MYVYIYKVSFEHVGGASIESACIALQLKLCWAVADICGLDDMGIFPYSLDLFAVGKGH